MEKLRMSERSVMEREEIAARARPVERQNALVFGRKLRVIWVNSGRPARARH
jgi:hypothetical protein